MAIAPTAGTTSDSAGAQVTSTTITVPTGILGGDVVFVWSAVVPLTSTVATTTASSTGTTPVAVTGGTISGSEPLPATVTGQLFSFVAAGTTGSASSDVGKVITLSFSTSGIATTALQGYSGARVSGPVDVIGGAFGGANTASVTCPVESTTFNGDWALFFGGGAFEGGNVVTPAGSTTRQTDLQSSQVAASICDSNGTVGSAPASIGGGTFSTATATNSVLVAVTVGLVAAGAGAGTSPGAGLRLPPPQVMPQLYEAAWQRADWQGQGVADLTVAFASTASGVDTYNVTSPWNGNTQVQMRVLNPTAPNRAYPHAFLLMLPVNPNQATTNGDSVGVAQAISAHNNYNLTVVQPGYTAVGAEGPWYADNPLNTGIYYETYTLLVTAWIRKNLATTGNEKVYLIGFSRSGTGGQGLQFRHPGIYAATASWDAPFMMTDYDGTDPTNGATVGGNPSAFYGTSSSFTTKYQLSSGSVANWKATGQFAVNRLWVGLGPSFQADTSAYDSLLTSAGVPHTFTFSNTVETHAWQNDWVSAALAAIIPSDFTHAATVLPQQIPRPYLKHLLDLAEVRLDPGIPASPVQAGGAALSGAGTLTASPQFAGSAALSGAGSLTASPALAGTAALSGSGTLSASVTLGAPAGLSGTGTLSAAPALAAAASLSGSGTLSAVWTLRDTVALSGSGTLSFSQGQASASLTGSGTLTASPALAGTAALSGTGTLTAATALTLAAAAALSGSGTLAAAWRLGLTAALSGSGTLTGVLIPPFTVGSLTASVTPSATLSAAAQRAGGPS